MTVHLAQNGISGLLWMVVGPIVVVFAILGAIRAAKQRKALINLAAANRWSFTAAMPGPPVRWSLNPFDEGHSQRSRNIVSGSSGGWPFVALDYRYTTGSGKESHTYEYAVTAVQTAVPMPSLSVGPDNVLSRIFSGNDIQLESEDFNRAYRVTADVPKFAYDVLPARTLAMLLSRPPISWHFDGPWLVTFERGGQSPSTLLSQLDTAKRILGGIPDFVWKDLGAPLPPTP